MGRRQMAAWSEIDGVIEEIDERYVGDLTGLWFQRPVRAVTGQVDEAY